MNGNGTLDVVIADYLARIGYRGPTDATAATLRALHLAHLFSVPFENLDIHLGRDIVLDDARLLAKVVGARRGGFCYELNGTFAALLRALGFAVSKVSAEVASSDGGFSPPFDHMALIVEPGVSPGERWLVDVGFGEGFRAPLQLDNQDIQPQALASYRLRRDGDYRLVEAQGRDGSDWQPQYRFTERPHADRDFEPRCRWHQTSAESHFRKNRLCTLATEAGRITLSGRKLITTVSGERSERELTSDAEVTDVLRDPFGISL